MLKIMLLFGLSTLFMGCACWFTANRTAEEEDFCELLFGVAAGAGSSNINEKMEYAGSNSGGGSLIGPHIGVDVFSPISKRLSLQSGLRFAGKGNKTSFESEGDGGEGAYSFEDKIRLNYLDMPLLARYRIGEGGFSVYGGVQPSLLLSAKQKSEGTGSEGQTTDAKDSYKSLDMAGSVGVGYAFGNGLNVNLGYDHGLSNIAKSDALGMGKIQNRTIKLTLGYTLGKKK